MYRSLESTCLHYPEFRTLVSWADTTICNTEEMASSICLTFGCSCQRITLGSLHDSEHPQTARKCCQPWWGLWCSGSLPRSTEVSLQKVSRVLLSRGSQWCFPCGLQQCFYIDADWGTTQCTPSLHLTSISSNSLSYIFFSFISKSDVDFLGICFHWTSRDVDQALNYSFHS